MARSPFSDPYRVVQEKGMLLDFLIKQMTQSAQKQWEAKKQYAMQCFTKLDALSPLKTLTRGYTLTKKEGTVIKSVEQIQEQERLQIQFLDGEIETEVKEVRRYTNA